MKCPNCNAEIAYNTKICPQCKIDVYVLKKVTYTSICLYNKGLMQAQAKDYSCAIESLKKSVAFDKNNIVARNLLGLVYFKIGHIADACKQWIISINLKPENNPAEDYLEDFKKDARNFDKLDDAVKMFNHAKKYLEQENDDLAIIRLKKAIDINPDFVEAYNLLSLAYIKTGNKQKAQEMAEKALTKDINNDDALFYLKELSNNVSKRKVIAKSNVETVEKIEPGKRYDYKRPTVINMQKNSLGVEIASFAGGLICAVLVMYILLIPSAVETQRLAYEDANAKYIQKQKEYNELQASMNETISKLESENKDLKVKADGYDTLKQAADKTEVVKKAQVKLEEGSIKESASLIASVDLTGVTEKSLIDQYNNLKKEVYPKAAELFHKEGETAYKEKNYTEALNAFNSCLKYASTDEQKYTAEYRLGCIAREQNNTELAKQYFSDVKANHPYAKYRNWADTELRSL